MKKQLLLITSSPHHPNAKKALIAANTALANGHPCEVFFYADGAYTANRLMWQTADVPDIGKAWVKLAEQYQVSLPVCVSTALARGITDSQNAERHGLDTHNIRAPFCLVGLSELALKINDDVEVVQF